MRGRVNWTRKISGPRHDFRDFFWLVLETGKFIFGLGAIPGKIYVKEFGSLSMSSICWPSLENEAGEDRDIMKNISRENDDFRLENVSSQDVSYAFRITQGALWRPHGMFWSTFGHLKVGTFLAENVAENMFEVGF